LSGIHPNACVEDGAQLGARVAVGANAFIAASAVLGDDVMVHPGVYVGSGCVVGDGTVLYPHVVLYHGSTIGSRCILHAGVVIGADGFGFEFAGGVHRKVPQAGTVEIGDDVEVGANSTIDRARLGKTRIGTGTKIDNLVQIGHNAQIGKHCVLCGMVGISGSARIGNYVTVAAGAGVAGHLEIGDGVTVAGLSGVTKSIEAGRTVSGFPAIDHAVERRVKASARRLPEALRTVRALEQRVAALENQLHGRPSEDDR
jgi:UDP-3-O-[3-hydroxymyristoyl] glucosamine N-acyltransferase